jgi:hypothetical protein
VTDETTKKQLKQLLPRGLDDIIRENRDELRLALATEAELKALETTIAEAQVRHQLIQWNVLMLHVSADGSHVLSPRLVGRVVDSGESWITSHVVGIDAEHGLVQTKSSLYRIMGPRADETDTDLLRICAALHEWGLGTRFGVPPIIY